MKQLVTKKRLVALFLVLLLGLQFLLGKQGVQAETRLPEVTEPSAGNVMIAVDGTFYPADQAVIVNRINAIRKEAYDAGYVDEYVPIKWSQSLEEAARTRAAEALLTLDHSRLTTKSIYTAGSNIRGENLAWNFSTTTSFLQAIDQWYAEKEEYIKEINGQAHGETGHYLSIIEPYYTHMGLGSFSIDSGKWTAVAQLFSRTPSSEQSLTSSGRTTQVLEALETDISELQLDGTSTLTMGETGQLSVRGTLKSSLADHNWMTQYARWVYPSLSVGIYSGVSWSSSNPAVATVDAAGRLVSNAPGKTIISAHVGSKQVQKEITVKGIVSLGTTTLAIKTGQTPSLPQTVTATWTDGTKTQEAVTWSPADYINNSTSARVVQVTGRVSNTGLIARATVTVHGIQSLSSVAASIKTGQTPSLPQTVTATWTDGTKTQVAVNWTAGNYTNSTNIAKKITVMGVVSNTSLKSNAVVTIHGIKSFSPVSLKVKSGQAPVLPNTVTALWTDGSTSAEAVQWNRIAATSYTRTIPGQFVVAGKVSKTGLAPQAQISVIVATKADTVHLATRTGKQPTFPSTVLVTWSDGSTSRQPVRFNTSANYYYSTQKRTVVIPGIIEGIDAQIAAQARVTIDVIASIKSVLVTTVTDQAPSLPTTVEVTWTDGGKTMEAVTWNPISKLQYMDVFADKQFEVTGKVANTPLLAVAKVQVVAQTVPLYRLYNAGLKVHLYTKDITEYQGLVPRGWQQEGLSWYTALKKGDVVYRLYHPKLRVHLYTKDTSEYAALGKRGWQQEGQAFYSYGQIPIYRLYHKGVKKHLYTRDVNEYNGLVAHGWQQEGIAFYAVK